jgi:FMN-binding domain
MQFFMPFCRFALAALLALCFIAAPASANEAEAQQRFIDSAFDGAPPAPKTLWLDKRIKAKAKTILQHDYAGLRVRYWQDGARTLWVLDETGKYEPITVGVIIENGAIAQLTVLAYRESRGWEVKHDFFTRQFIGATLPKKQKLDRRISGISGATLSVRALKKLARLALYFDQQVQHS